MRRFPRVLAGAAACVSVLVVAACGSSSSNSSSSSPSSSPSSAASGGSSSTLSGTSALQQTLNFAAHGSAPKGHPTVAWVKADATNPYTLAELKGGMDAAKKYGVNVKLFAAAFNPATQAQQLQDALTGYDAGQYQGILVEPVAGQVICPPLRNALAHGVPVAIDNGPICGADGYYPGTVGYAGMQLERYFVKHVQTAFASCQGKPCQAAVLTGPVGFDNVTRFETALKTVGAQYPNVKVVVNQPTDFSPQQAYTVMRDALTAHPDINLVVSDWDDMMTGAVRAIQQDGKKPGTQIRIYSNGADTTGEKLIRAGQMTESTLMMPYEEGEYAMYQLIRYLATKQKTPGSVWLGDSPVVTSGPGSIFITQANIDKWKPEY